MSSLRSLPPTAAVALLLIGSAAVAQDYVAQDYVAQDYVAQDYVAQDYVAQDYVAQDYVAQDYVAQDYVAQDYVAQDYVAQDHAAQDQPKLQPTHDVEITYDVTRPQQPRHASACVGSPASTWSASKRRAGRPLFSIAMRIP
jgi:pentapeptide MXKDX repeat protein